MTGGDMRPGEHGAGRRSMLADKLNHLFASIHPPRRGPYSPAEAAAAIEQAGGPSISGTYIWMLRNGQRDNPSMQVIAGIAGFFGVPVGYFFDEETTARVDAQLELLTTMVDTGVRNVATRAADLSPAGLRAIREMIDHVRHVEGVPEGDEGGPAPPA